MTRNNKFLQPVESCSVVSFRTARPLGARTIGGDVCLSMIFKPGFIFTWTFLNPDYKITSMKKLFLIAVLCITPLFVSHAANLTKQDCINWKTYDDSLSEEHYKALPSLLKEIVDTQQKLHQWVDTSKLEIYDKDNIKNTATTSITALCKDAVDETDKKNQERMLQKTLLFVQKALSDYEEVEVRERMPFIHHGNVLPGPSENENGSDYLEQRFIPKFINGTLIFLMSLSILMVIVGGLMFVFSAGDSDLNTRAKTTIMWAIVGVVITILSYAIVQFIIGIDFTL